jgi:type IV pilus assembly protein PilA
MKRHIEKNIKGFTLIELMIVIAIIGILAAIALPNFIQFRDKTFCTQTESDANSLAKKLSDYFAIPANQSFTDVPDSTSVLFPGSTTFFLSGSNTGSITRTGATNQYTITVTDQSGRCPASYRNHDPLWSGGAIGTYSITTY